ncbi:hypothetical protein GCM10007092_15370 [Thermus composti]|nr:glycerol-3-phosphate dehydrogenase C-terminal domain-containing protein [Thermus composti]GGN02041.1 hypothetical protein GCM10007092_15370 [Thermus composti]
MRYLLALDQGTTSSRAILFTLEGRPVAVAQREFRQLYPKPGWVEHDPLELWETTLWAAQEALRRAGVGAGEILALGDRPLLPGLPYLEGEVVYAVREELTRKPLDVLARRMGLAFLDREKARQALPRVVERMASLLG